MCGKTLWVKSVNYGNRKRRRSVCGGTVDRPCAALREQRVGPVRQRLADDPVEPLFAIVVDLAATVGKVYGVTRERIRQIESSVFG